MQALINEAERRGYAVQEFKPGRSHEMIDVCIAIDSSLYPVTIREKSERLQVTFPGAYGAGASGTTVFAAS